MSNYVFIHINLPFPVVINDDEDNDDDNQTCPSFIWHGGNPPNRALDFSQPLGGDDITKQ